MNTEPGIRYIKELATRNVWSIEDGQILFLLKQPSPKWVKSTLTVRDLITENGDPVPGMEDTSDPCM